MGQHIKLTASNGHTLGAYRVDPAVSPVGGLVVVQEIFGVNQHIRSVCDRFAAVGYAVVGPAVFDRFVPSFESGYTADEIAFARGYLAQIKWTDMIADISAAKSALNEYGPVGIVGFCMGGTAAFLSACRIPGVSVSISYYGGAIGEFETEKPKCPVLMHFGEKDEGVPLEVVEKIKSNYPEAEVFLYENAPHGFSCNERPSYRKEAAERAWIRTNNFLVRYLR